MSEHETTFRAELERLEAIVRQLEEEELDLDRALALFEEGITHLKTARQLLSESEIAVKRVLEEADGTIRAQDVND
ncbi:MAG: exodeoxyribonuclease VII small subunit [Gemmatimonadales bacterium]